MRLRREATSSSGRDREADRPAELDPVRALVEVDQDGQRMRRAGVPSRGLRHGLGRLARDLARRAGAPVRPTAAQTSPSSRDTTPRRNDLLRPRQMADARGDLPARERLDDRQRRPAVRQLREHDALERLVVLRQDEVAEALAHLLLDRRELPADVVHVGAAHRQLGLELRVVRAEAELHAAVRHQLLHAGEQRVDVRLAEPVGVEPLQVDHRLHAALGEEPRDDLLLEHAPQLARNARREEEARAADVEREAARGADRIVDHLRGGGQHGLLPVVGRHHAAAPLEEVLHPGEPLLVQRELDAGRLGRDLLRQVVDRRAEAAVDDDRVRAALRRA